MKTVRNYIYAALLAVSALNFAPTLASAQEMAYGKFTLTHEVHWGNAKLPVGDYVFSFDPDSGSSVLTLSKVSGARSAYMVLVPSTEAAKPSGQNRLVLETTPNGMYVSAMQLPEFGVTLDFTVPPHAMERQIARTGAPAAAGQ